ncbi:MAG: hypothetical protein D6731_23645 [Planctomycetota bacterium]|nr:MAG: hypothetical protein D6731_23645 [Planctomycetota bacterium]
MALPGVRPLASATLLLAAAFLLPAPARARPPGEPDPGVFEEAWRLFRERFYRRDLRGVDWKAAGERHRPKALRARTQRDVHEAILDLLAELKASHATVVSDQVYRRFYEAEGKSQLVPPPPQFGLQLVRLEEGFFVGHVLFGSPAEAAGAKRGDRVLSVDGRLPDPRDMFALGYDSGLGGPRAYRLRCGEAGSRTVLGLERFRDPKYGRLTVTLTAVPWNEVEAARASYHEFAVHGAQVAYFRLYHLLSRDVVLLLAERLARSRAEAFVLDLRGMGGRAPLVDEVLSFFDRNGPGRALWERPAVALIDGSSRSAKEVLAWGWRSRGVGPLVGRRTAGAILGAQFARLSDGSWLMIPVMDMRSATGGVVVEGKGIAPDVEVAGDLRWARGRDEILAKGLEVAAERALAARRAGRRHGWH